MIKCNLVLACSQWTQEHIKQKGIPFIFRVLHLGVVIQNAFTGLKKILILGNTVDAFMNVRRKGKDNGVWEREERGTVSDDLARLTKPLQTAVTHLRSVWSKHREWRHTLTDEESRWRRCTERLASVHTRIKMTTRPKHTLYFKVVIVTV